MIEELRPLYPTSESYRVLKAPEGYMGVEILPNGERKILTVPFLSQGKGYHYASLALLEPTLQPSWSNP